MLVLGISSSEVTLNLISTVCTSQYFKCFLNNKKPCENVIISQSCWAEPFIPDQSHHSTESELSYEILVADPAESAEVFQLAEGLAKQTQAEGFMRKNSDWTRRHSCTDS